MKSTPQRFQLQIDFDTESTEFEARIVSQSSRKGYLDLPAMKKTLEDILRFMAEEGVDDLLAEKIQ